MNMIDPRDTSGRGRNVFTAKREYCAKWGFYVHLVIKLNVVTGT